MSTPLFTTTDEIINIYKTESEHKKFIADLEETFSDEGEPDGYDYKSYKYRPNKKKKRQYLLILNIVVVLIHKPNLKNKIMKNGGGNGGGCGCGK